MIVRSLEAFPAPQKASALTIGSFDGVHIGHRALLKELKERGYSVVITFENHPAEVVRPDTVPSKLCSTPHKLKLLEESGVDVVILLKFTSELSLLSAEEFLLKVRKAVPFDTLLLGPDATLGKDRQGDQKRLQKIAKELSFHLEHLQALTFEGTKISSSAIREKIRAGDLATAEQLLGRKFSIFAPIHTGAGLGKKIGFPTLNLSVESLCLPPLGVYAVSLNSWHGVANLGVAPTVRKDLQPILEVHLFDYHPEIQDQSFVEVTFEKYLRPEKKFENVEQLKIQIAQDVRDAKAVFG